MTQTVSAREIQAAGGLAQWLIKEAMSPSPPSAATAAKNASIPPAKHCVAPKNQGRAPAGCQAKGRLPADRLLGYEVDRMNGLEARYAGHLEAKRRVGSIVFWKYEAVKLRLADGAFYTPDFFLMLADGRVGFHETKGFWRDDAKIKIKVAAELYPWLFFVGVQWNSKAKDWRFEPFRATKSPSGEGRGKER